MTTLHLKASSDTSGNPRRLYAAYVMGDLVAVYDEGYQGTGAMQKPIHRAAYQGTALNITVHQYYELLKLAK